MITFLLGAAACYACLAALNYTAKLKPSGKAAKVARVVLRPLGVRDAGGGPGAPD